MARKTATGKSGNENARTGRPLIPHWSGNPASTSNPFQNMTRPLQSAPCRQISLAIDDDLLALLDELRRADPDMPSRSEVARSLMWAGAAILAGLAPDDQHDADALTPLKDVVGRS